MKSVLDQAMEEVNYVDIWKSLGMIHILTHITKYEGIILTFLGHTRSTKVIGRGRVRMCRML